MPVDITRFEKLRDILADMTGNEAGDIYPESDLEEDLGMIIEADLPRVIKRINHEFDIKLDLPIITDQVTTVEDMLTFINDEAELG